jgi:hypothetical protein
MANILVHAERTRTCLSFRGTVHCSRQERGTYRERHALRCSLSLPDCRDDPNALLTATDVRSRGEPLHPRDPEESLGNYPGTVEEPGPCRAAVTKHLFPLARRRGKGDLAGSPFPHPADRLTALYSVYTPSIPSSDRLLAEDSNATAEPSPEMAAREQLPSAGSDSPLIDSSETLGSSPAS